MLPEHELVCLNVGDVMASRVLLATCSLAERWLPNEEPANGHYPLGLGYLHSVLEEAGHEVQTTFLNNVALE